MIQVEQHPNFSKWQTILSFGEVVNQVQGKANALRIASKHAKRHGISVLLNDGEIVNVKDILQRSHSEQLWKIRKTPSSQTTLSC